MKNMIRKFVFSLIVMMLVCVSFMLVAFVAPAAADVEVYFRVMPPVNESEYAKTGELYTLWAGNVTIPKEVNITCESGWQYHLYIDDNDHYIQDKIDLSNGEVVASKDRGTGKWNKTVGATSVLAALHNASELGNFSYNVSDAWWIDMGFFVEAIGGGPKMDWTYRIYNPEYALMPTVGSDSCLLGYNTTDTLTTLSPPQTQILWEHGGYPLKVTTNKGEVDVGEEFTATVRYYPGDLGELVEWEPLGEVKLNVTGVTIETFISDDNGDVTIFMESNGTFELQASKRQYAGTYYVPSDNRTKVNVPGGAGASATWWTQTTKGNFSAGTCNQVNISVSPGDVLLEQGGQVTEDYVLDGETATLGREHFYNNFTLINGATLNVPLGEILRVHANYIEVDSTSSINATGKGYSGGAGGAGDGNDGKGKEGGCFGVHNSTYGGGGGGAGHGGKGHVGSKSQCDANADGGPAGGAYGKDCTKGDDTFYMGSGGGGGAGNGSDKGGDGGYGGGVVVLEGMSLENEPTIVINGKITAEGSNATDGEGCGCGGGGGSSGGTILIKGKNMVIANGSLSVRGGNGGNGATGGCKPDCGGGGGGGGGGAGGGHIKVFFESMPYSSGHNVKGGAGGAGEYEGYGGAVGTGTHTDHWYNYTANGETYSPILPFWSSGNLTSAAFDTGYSADFDKIYWCAATSSNTSVKFQIATNNDNFIWDFKGPDGTSNTYYETSSTSIWSGHDGDRYIGYKAFLSTTDVGKTPTMSKVGITYKEEGGELPVHNLDTGENFSTIQEAIDAANTADGHTITVGAGTYTENVDVITKSLTIRSTSGNPEDTIIQASNLTDHVFEVTTDYVNLSGFTVKGATGDGKAGIYLYSADHCVITNNTYIGNYYGIELIGFNCTVKDNTVRNNTMYGIYVFGNHSKIYYNDLKYNDNYGLKMYNSFGNCIYGNAFISNNIDHPEHTSQAYDNGDNYWRSTVKLGYYNDSGVPFDNYVGNYWSDYTGVDSDGDGIGDTAYQIDG